MTRWLSICAAAGMAGCAIGLLLDPAATLACYLAAWFAVSAIPIGALGVLLISYLVRGGWTQDLHEPFSRAALTIPVAGLLFVVVLAGATTLYPWAGNAALPSFKAVYLSPGFFALRAIAYFTIWTALALWARQAYGNPAAMERAGALGLIVWAPTVSLAGVDWLESIEPTFHSSIYGLLVLTFTLLAALAFGLVVVLTQLRSRRMANTTYAAVLLATLLLWAYLHAMQYIIIWAGNIPDEVVWYAVRAQGAGAVALWLLFVGQFIVPFFALLSARVRASTRALCAIAGLTLALRALEAAILVLPPLAVGSLAIALCFPAAILAIGATLLLAWQMMPRWIERRALRGAPGR